MPETTPISKAAVLLLCHQLDEPVTVGELREEIEAKTGFEIHERSLRRTLNDLAERGDLEKRHRKVPEPHEYHVRRT